ncbi:MAG: hypothetical protein BWX64_02501 [Acidobacteria bacterium ADurb.Bin051]|nr:MAG: hypothetical protein BWX64_02501 [Acidobacteria bacterium ADurb.Bin051]
MTTRSGRRKSSIAEPSRRNSGFETTANSWLPPETEETISSTIWPVPTGTVDFVITTLKPLRFSPIDWATWRTNERSAEPSGSGGVPTAMKTACASRTAGARSVVKASRPAFTFFSTISSRPGS